jgi:hypothetical protein
VCHNTRILLTSKSRVSMQSVTDHAQTRRDLPSSYGADDSFRLRVLRHGTAAQQSTIESVDGSGTEETGIGLGARP